jgi:cellulose synthase/poly-beta-1,6-N-acetylglucosamine synthase-like glycosyltransferase
VISHLLAFAGIAVMLLTLPLILELFVLTVASRLPKRRPAGSANAAAVRLAVIIPAHNEEALIATCVESLRASAAGTNTRIIAVAHNCSDRTAQRAAKAGAEVMVYNDPAAQGKGSALAVGFEYCTAQGMDATLVVDADSAVSLNLIGAVREAMANGAEGVQCRYELDSSSKRPTTRLTALAFRGFNVVRAAGRDRLGLSSGLFGNGFAIRQDLLARKTYDSKSVVEDLEFHLELVSSGVRVQFLRSALVSSGMPASKQGDTTQRSRWEGGRLQVASAKLLPLLRKLATGNLRVLEPALDLASLPIGYGAALLVVAVCLPLPWLRMYALIAMAVLAGHVLAAAWDGPDFLGDMRILSRVPGYILWKLRVIPKLLRTSRTDAVWVRTERLPALPFAVQDATLESDMATGQTVEHALQITHPLEIS